MFIRTNSHTLSNMFTGSKSAKLLKQRKIRRFFLRSRKRMIRYSLLGANLALLSLVVFFVAKSPATNQAIHHSAIVNVLSSENIAGPLDQVSSADIAVHVARTIGLPEANSVTNHADSVSATEATTPADTAVVAKPQLVSTALPSRKDIHTYTAAAGDTISSIAVKFGVTSDSIRGSNNLTSDRVAEGKVLMLPPKGANGIVYAVKSGDTADSLAQKYNVNKDAIITFNDAEVTGLVAGQQILIPDAIAPAPVVRAASYSYYSAASSHGFAWGGDQAVYNGANGYDYGWCTWHAANRRREMGRPIPSNLGNANTWISLAKASGLAVGSAPQAGAVFSQSGTGYLGHVGVVEKVNDDGSFEASDMNYPIWGRVTNRTVSAGELGGYRFIY